MELTLDTALASARGLLAEAVRNRQHAMHAPVVGTADGDLRIMVLREASADLSCLRFHTDLRSPKCALIGQGAPVSILAYDPAQRVQLRMRGHGRIEHSSLVSDAAWERASPSSRRCYLAEAGPSTLLEKAGSALPGDLLHRSPLVEETLPGRSNFAVLLVEVRSLDWLRLTHFGGERCRFTRDSAAMPWRAEWLAP